MYSDSDDEYDESGRWRHSLQSRESAGLPPLRLYHSIEYKTKRNAYREVLEQLTNLYENNPRGYRGPSEKELLRSHLDDPNLSVWEDWRRWRVVRFFRDIHGFHKGSLDLSGRSEARYNALLKTLSAFVADFGSFSPLVERVEVEREEFDFEANRMVEKTALVPVVRDTAAWEVFRRKWGLPRSITYEDLWSSLVETRQVFGSHGRPQFQTLWITDFPPEVLMIIFSYTSVEEARALSATCHYLRDAGLTYIFTTRKIWMSPPSNLREIVLAEEPVIISEQVLALFAANRDKCIREIDFLSSRPDIRSRVRRMSVGYTWSTSMYDGCDIGDALEEVRRSQKHARAFLQKFTELLLQLDLESLQLHGVDIDLDLALRLTQQPSLTNLEVRFCDTLPPLWEHILSSPPGSLQSRVQSLNLELHQGEEAASTFSAWNVLALCPDLRVLRVSALNNDGFDMPDPPFWRHMACIAHVEYLHLHGVYWNQINDLVDWLAQSAASSGGLRMTHLKVHSALGIPDAMVGQLLQSLHTGHAPLRVLALDGIIGMDAAFFDTLGQLFPLLEGLTLVRRASGTQYHSKLCQWPLPVYEYAQHMQGLAKLRHFGANFYWQYDQISPAVLRRLEPGYAAEEDPDFLGWDYMEDGRSIALPFAAYCPTLETFAVTADRMRYGARVRRSATGTIAIESFEPQFSDPEFDAWNPGAYPTRAWLLPEHKV